MLKPDRLPCIHNYDLPIECFIVEANIEDPLELQYLGFTQIFCVLADLHEYHEWEQHSPNYEERETD